MDIIINIADTILFIMLSVSVLYLLIFAIASLKKRKIYYPDTEKRLRFVILFPAYKEDKVIVESVKSFLNQDYPTTCFNIVIISDELQDETNSQLLELPVKVLIADYENRTKAKALNFAIDNLNKEDYDVVVVMDADNTVDKNFLHDVNKAFCFGMKAVQTHRIAKNANSDIAILDAASEEINNSLFRKGHVRLGLSSALSGSGMAFDYEWFSKSVKNISSVGEDKELELELLRQGIYIDYLDNTFTYDLKVKNKEAFGNQRQRWIATQYDNFTKSIKYIPKALSDKNIDLCNKIIQWIMLPRLIMLGLIILITFALFFINLYLSIKWWILLALMGLVLSIAIPDKMVNDRLFVALSNLPKLFVIMVINLFKMKGGKKKFIHTEH